MRAGLRWLGFWTLLGLVGSLQAYLADRRTATFAHGWWEALVAGLSAWYVCGLLALGVARLGRRFRMDRANFERHFILHLGASLDLALVHTFAAVGVQAALHAFTAQPFDFGPTLLDTFIQYYHWNVLIYWAILAVVHAHAYHKDLEERPAAPEPAAADGPLDRILVRARGRSYFVRLADVDWIEAARNYVTLHAGAERHVVRTTLAALEARLDPRRFRRISRSTLVNLDRVEELQPWFHGDAVCILRGGRRLTVSRNYRDRVFVPLAR